MKLLNKKGFVLVETLVVTAFVMALFIFVYQNAVPFIGEYEKMYSYDDIDSVYASNLLKKVILRDGDFDTIDDYLDNNTYMDITDCSDNTIYKTSDYCQKLKKSLSISDDDYIFITKYDISSFREEVKENDFFDSGRLSSFRSYINTVSDIDSFYDKDDEESLLVGKYRLFITRTVVNSDGTTSLKYSNLGIYSGKYDKYYAGDVVKFNPGDGEKNFYVLNDSDSSEEDVVLILANNFSNKVSFNSVGTSGSPDTVLSYLKEETKDWTNVDVLTSSDKFVSNSGYTINYNGYRARLLEPNDLYKVLKCGNDTSCFDTNSLFSVSFDTNTLGWLSNGLTNNNGYWLASDVGDSNNMAWTIQNGVIKAVAINNSSDIGLRAVVVVSKDKLK